ncbi:hypothetical protein HMPREF9099_02426 [Lachnospiraceae bacterium oral taxon 082 str. F0431]|nr:hypothetical protein HMPREF9099_02426 [Lachnospiraceae bacterium oral taxon 082 str. F0431]
MGFRVIEIQQFLIRLSGTTDMLDLNKIVSLKSFIQTTEEDKEENLLPFFSLFLRTKYSLNTMPEKIMFIIKKSLI